MANLISARFGAKCAEHFVLFSYRSILLRVSECAPWEVLVRQFPYLPLMQQILKRSSTKTGLSWEDMGKIIIFSGRTQVFAIPEIVIRKEGCLTL